MHTAITSNRSSHAGVTLVELLVAMTIFSIVTTMLVSGWLSLQRASAFTVQSNNARAEARDGLSRVSIELRDAQPAAMPTSTATPAPTWSVFTVAQPMEVVFYSAYNMAGANADGTGTAALRLTRIWLDTTTVPPPPAKPEGKTLYWQRDTYPSPNGDGVLTSADRTVVLARYVVNNSVPDPSVTPATSYTPIFKYAYRDSGTGGYTLTDNSGNSLDLTTIIAVQIRLITDINLAHTPSYIDLSTTVRPRNASGS